MCPRVFRWEDESSSTCGLCKFERLRGLRVNFLKLGCRAFVASVAFHAPCPVSLTKGFRLVPLAQVSPK